MTEATPQTSVEVNVDGGTLHSFQFGDGVPDVLAIHGATSNHLVWADLHAAMPETTIAAPDLRGRGASSDLPGPFGMERHAEDLAALLHQVTDRPVIAVGHSMGAFAAVTLAVKYPELVDRLVLIDGGSPLPKPPSMIHESPHAVSHALLEAASRRLSGTYTSQEEYLAMFRQHPAFSDHWTPRVEQFALYDLVGEAPALTVRTSTEAMYEDFAELFVGGVNERISSRLQQRTEVLRAPRGLVDQAPVYPPGYLDAWATTLPDVLVNEVGGTNHYTILFDAGVQRIAKAVRL